MKYFRELLEENKKYLEKKSYQNQFDASQYAKSI